MSVSVLVADDHPMFRAGMVTVLQDLDDIEVVGQAANGREAVELVARMAPDVVLMDLRMPEVGGLEATARIKVEHPDTAVIVLTMDSDDDSIFAALRAGARGYLLKESDGLDIERAINGVARGEAVFGAGIAERVLTLFSQGRSSAVSPFPELTPRELEMLELIAGGLDNPTIARRLFLSEKTVRNRVSAILTKLHARSRAEMVALARDAGLGGPAS
ncbi:response regulator transcription factor [Nocardioides marmoribigeumensis]|jgi:DNA-binding NarL/FixJ family response regulator|uniref:DNA-binding NarL/FixJ family response regulator n=1 Tax=Nocardioides marmoribigeumensis TaxID=433649 RepID=A0ABU2BSL9_9ACTN|nr:response regulator transcription factor [Nocardioides marmoribigeumensis]MDR7361266.1 DNA-binding NarL/FixJ family response regulator [Nocardioides marmoribigeumensis]